MATLKDIRSTNWQISLQGAGQIEEGLADIRQCIDVILRTGKGGDALRPQFGSDIYQYIDKPVTITVPNVKKAIFEALGIWEKRVKNVRITHLIKEQQIQFFIYYTLADEEVTDVVQLYLKGGDVVVTPVVVQKLILQGIIPSAYLQLLVSLVLDGVAQLPLPPAYGFTTPAAMYSWVVNNWGFIGAWYLLPGKLMLFVNSGFALTGSITITTLALNRYVFPIPEMEAGQQLQGVVTMLDVEIGDTTEPTISDLLAWLNANFSSKGNWTIESLTGDGDFDKLDFDNMDFNVFRNYYQFVLYTTDNPGAVLTITAV